MAENESKYTLNLDAEQFTAAANKAAGALTGIGEAGESIGKLIETLEVMGGALGILTVAFLGVGAAFKSVFRAEEIEATTRQFDMLATSANVFAGDLKKGLEEASKGWVDSTELMQHANKSMSELEVGAEKLPEVMDLARKASQVMGTDFMATFDAMSQAVATGNTRGLRHLGIVIDQNKAYRDYAASIGGTVETLSLAGKQQAVMNALLEQGNQKFQGQGEELKKNTSLWLQFKTTLKEFGDILAIILAKFSSPVIGDFFEKINKGLTGLKHSMQDAFHIGNATDQAAAHVAVLKDKVLSAQEAIAAASKAIKIGGDPASMQMQQKLIDDSTQKLKEYEAELKKLDATEKKLEADREVIAGKAKAAPSSLDPEKVKKQAADIQKEVANLDKELAGLDKQLTAEEIKDMQTVEQANKLYSQKRVQEAAATQVKISEVEAKQAEIRAKAAAGTIKRASAEELAEYNKLKANEMAVLKKTDSQEIAELKRTHNQIVQLNKIKVKQLEQDDAELAAMQRQALDNYQQHSENVFQGVGRAFETEAQRMKMEISDAALFGTNAMNAFKDNSISALEAWGSGTKSAADAAKGAFFGMIGQVAEQYGSMLIMMGIGSLNPGEVAIGAALVAFGAYLKSLGGSSGSTSFGGGGGSYSGGAVTGGGGDMSGGLGNTPLPAQAANQTQQPPSGVHIVVQGSVFDTEATRVRMADLVRGAQDSTDFSIQKVGGGV